MEPNGWSLPRVLTQRGVSRRAFLKFCGGMAAHLALPASFGAADCQGPGHCPPYPAGLD